MNTHKPERKPAGISHYLVLVLAASLAILGCAALIASFLSPAAVLRAIDGSGNNDQLQRGADSLVRNFSAIIVKLRYCSAVLFLVAFLTALQRARIQTWISEAILPFPRFLLEVCHAIIRGLRADGKLHAGLLLTLSVAGAALRLRYLFQPMRVDEAETFVSYASRPLPVGLSWYPAPNNHLFHTLLVHFSWKLFGEQEWAIRLPALIAGVLLIPLTYWAARAIYDKHVAVIAAGLVTAASWLIHYSVDARGYTLLSALFLLLLITSRYLLEHDSRPAWLLWVILATLGFYTIPTMLYAVATAAVWMLISFGRIAPASRRGSVVNLGVALALTASATALLYLPVLVASGWRNLVSNPWVTTRSFAFLLRNSMGASEAWQVLTADVPTILTVILCAAFAVALVFYRQSPGKSIPVPIAAALSIAPLLLTQRVVPYARVWLFLIPVGAAVCGAGLWLMLGRFANRDETRCSFLSAAVAVCCVAAMSVPDFRGTRSALTLNLVKFEDTAMWIQGHVAPGDLVVVKGAGWTPLTYYFRRHGLSLVSRPAPCDPRSVVYTAKGVTLEKPAIGRRVLTVSIPVHPPEVVLSGACLAWQPSPAPRLVYENEVLRIHEGRATRVVAQRGAN